MLANQYPFDAGKETWFDGGTVCVNRCHAAYAKAENRGFLEYHVIKSAVLSILEFNLEKETDPDPRRISDIIQRFFKLWGEMQWLPAMCLRCLTPSCLILLINCVI